MSFKRYDNVTESAQARWLRRSTLPATATPLAQQTTGEFGEIAEEKPAETSDRVYEPKRRPSYIASTHRRASSNPATPAIIPKSEIQQNPRMQAIKLQKKYPQVTQEEMFSLIEKFKYASSSPSGNDEWLMTILPSVQRD